MEQINFSRIEKKWQERWERKKIFESFRNEKKEKFFMIFAYPGISGYQHVGHMRGYSYTDIICRFKRMKGFNVLFPAGTHASGNQAIVFANKVKNNDKDWIKYLKRNGCKSSTIKTLTTPKKIVEYFNKVYRKDFWKKFGFSYDDTRFTSSIYPDYNKFIEWQFNKLKDNNLLIQKPYFATACPSCGPVAVDASETDISSGGSAEKLEYTLLKFKFKDKFLVAATLRPETIFGQTNLWVNPKIELVEVKVENEIWIMSKKAYDKLKYQKDNLKLLGKFEENLIGRTILAPGIKKEIMILPSAFIDENIGSGIVTCVPSDAPYDFAALEDLKLSENEITKYGLDFEKVRAIKIIPIIKTKKYGENAGVKVVMDSKIRSQNDERLEALTQEVYKEGFHSGVLLDNCGGYSGMKVIEAKDKIKEELVKFGDADTMYDLSEEVICRCGKKVMIKKIDDQWFIKYSDKDLTEKSKEHAKHMNIHPKQYSDNFPKVLDWFQDRACARMGNWIGTKLPFDKRWIVEPISDSTLYPIYYLVSKYYNEKKIKLKEMDEKFFDYVFLGKGKAKNKIWAKVRKDVEYWYPLDVNLGGKEHQTVHFPVFLMNHVGILPEKMWPKGIFVNYWIVGKGSKISKSKGGAQPIPEAIEKYGVDSMRLYYSHIAGPEFDVIWDEKIVFDYRRNLERIYNLIIESIGKNSLEEGESESELLIKMNRELKVIEVAISSFDLRTAANSAFFILSTHFKKYLQDGGKNKKIINDFVKKWIRVMAPFCPHISEELWEKIEEKGFVSEAIWPEFKEIEKEEKSVNLNSKIVNDINLILEKTGALPKKVYVYVMPFELGLVDEKLISSDLKVDVKIFSVDDSKKYDPAGKAKKAKPGKAGIYFE
ncbi:MAG: leucine--tRNA ligase [archaeon]